MKRFLVCIFLFLTHLLLTHGVHAATIHPTFQGLAHRLHKDGMDPQYLTSVFTRSELVLMPETVAKGLVRKESRLNYAQFLENYAVNKAISYLKAHKNILMKVEGRFGISAPLVVAILSVETACGTYIGRYTTFNLLVTQALSLEPDIYHEIYRLIPSDEKRGLTQQTVKKRLRGKSRKAYRELKALLNYTRDHGIDPFSIQGSAEGAIGIPQFLPSNITVYGYDGDGDGKIDLFQHQDAIASVASFLKAFRWRKDHSHQKKKEIIRRYNPSDYYADTVLRLADTLNDFWP